MVRLAPRIQMPCAVGAISTGAPASTATASPWPTPAAARPPAICRARWWTSNQVCRTGASGSPVFMPLKLHWALANIVSVNLLTEIPLASAQMAQLVRTPGVRVHTPLPVEPPVHPHYGPKMVRQFDVSGRLGSQPFITLPLGLDTLQLTAMFGPANLCRSDIERAA